MSKSQQQIADLWPRYLSGHATDEEIRTLLQLLRRYPRDTTIPEYIRSLQDRIPGSTDAEVDWDLLWSNVEKGIRERRPVRARIVRYRWWAAAACVLLLAGVAYFRMVRRQAPPVAVSRQPDIERPPGGNKATLSLANGTTILLDSTSQGLVTMQGDVRIVKGGGQVSYEAPGGPAKRTGQALSGQVMYNTLSTPRGGVFFLRLPDGTGVWLNSASSITYPTAFGSGPRKVRMTGEAYFEVRHRSDAPFIVETGPETIRDVGTRFDVNAYADEPRVITTLLEGAVSVSGGKNTVELKPGEQAAVSSADPSGGVSRIRGVDLDRVMAWKNGWFEFDQAELPVVLRQISRWYDIDITFEGRPGRSEFGGRISRSLPLSHIVRLLENSGVKFKVEGRKLIVQP